MPKISGKFAPLTDELGYDHRFKKLTTLEKLLYLLIIHTTHMTRHQAPTDPRYYQLQYGLRAKRGALVSAMGTLTVVYPKLKCTSSGSYKTLSLLNSPTYESEIGLEEELEEELDRDKQVNKKQVVLKPEPKKSFSPPSLEEVVSFFATMGRTDGPVFFDHFTSNGWKVGGKTQMKDWHAAARNWDRRSPVKKGYDIWKTKPVTIPK